MGSIVPFQDLNLVPDPTTVAAAAAASAAAAAAASAAAAAAAAATSSAIVPVVVPKIEPKHEPFDEPFPVPLNCLPNPNSQTPLADQNSNFNILTQVGDASGDENNNVYSEFNRIQELFNTALGECSDVDTDPDARALVPVPDPNEELSTVVVNSRKKYPPRSSELVRVTDLGLEDERYFRDYVRKTRMVFDSLRVFSTMDDDRRLVQEGGRRTRGDIKASSIMKDSGLWLNRDKRIVGAIPGIHIGDLFFYRMELCVVGIHGQVQAGIDYLSGHYSSNREPIATSVIVSGGYEDDEDSGDVVIYTGHGGQDKNSRQCCHQKLEGGNLGLERSMHYGIEVRVIRGLRYEGSPSGKVYVYDGLYKVVESWFDVGKSGFGVYKFKLVRMEDQPEMGSSVLRFARSLRINPLEARPMGYLSLDLSMNKESVPVYLFNDIDNDNEPLYYEYLPSSVFPPYAYHSGASGCNCVSGCSDNCSCARRNGGEFAYDSNGLLVRGKPLIYECGPNCQCPPSCRNRVSQKGVKYRFEVFRSRETGWGVRSLDLIQPGSFICEYSGIVLTRDQAEVFTMNGDSLVYPNRFSERWAEWGDLSQIFSDYVKPKYPAVPPLDFAMDVSRMRNVACYMSHSSCPNVLVQLVLYDHSNILFPHLMLFALENIPPLREISLDYGMADEWSGGKPLPICN
jgi:euchromatic histone-lysine N-methyltransferase